MKKKQKKPSNRRWIVWGPKGTTNPKYVFDTEEAASEAADNMVRKHNDTFCVVEVKKVFRPTVTTDSDVSAYFGTGKDSFGEDPIPF